MASEKNFENRLKGWLNSQGIYALGTAKDKMTVEPCGYYEKRWGGGQFAKSGLPDMHVVLHSVSIELEIKAPTGKPSELQLKNLDLITKGNCYGFILVETHATVKRLKKWIESKYPQYSHIEVIDFEQFKNLCEKLIKSF